MFRYVSYTEWKKPYLEEAKLLLGDNLLVIDVDGLKPKENWFIYKSTFGKYCHQKNIIIDITTMTRESIWYSFYFSRIYCKQLNYIYYKPEGYSADWISRDPGKPRLLYKMSGIAKLGTPSLLLITGGYDIQRLESLIYYFEPQKTILFFQDGDDHRNKDNFRDCQDIFRTKYKIEMLFEYDAFNIEESFDIIVNKLNENEANSDDNYMNNYNIIFNSLGAKTSAITLFKIWQKYPKVSLSYIPSKEYNKEYSYGIGQSYSGVINF